MIHPVLRPGQMVYLRARVARENDRYPQVEVLTTDGRTARCWAAVYFFSHLEYDKARKTIYVMFERCDADPLNPSGARVRRQLIDALWTGPNDIIELNTVHAANAV